MDRALHVQERISIALPALERRMPDRLKKEPCLLREPR